MPSLNADGLSQSRLTAFAKCPAANSSGWRTSRITAAESASAAAINSCGVSTSTPSCAAQPEHSPSAAMREKNRFFMLKVLVVGYE